jgi:hypothetical protein
MKRLAAGLTATVAASALSVPALAAPAVLDRNLEVRTLVGGLTTPSSVAFLGPNDFLVLEKNTGKVVGS